MEQLSSCYFCGTALDASVETYPVVPRALEPTSDEQRAISLCPSCRQKLAHVVETVVSATEAGETDAVSADEIAPPTPDRDLAPEDDEAADAGGWVDGTETSDDEDTDSQQPDPTADSRQADDAANGQRTDPTPESQQSADSGRRQSRSQESTDTERDQSTADQSPSETEDGPSLTALEYNKVMRLLQNREFPVEKSEIKAVAINAYEVSEAEFDAIIEAAIDRGLIDEENGQFVAGD